MSNPYGVLGVRTDATDKEITKAFRAKARVLHPDKQPPDASNADKLKSVKAFQDLVGAYEVLSDATKRKRHDMAAEAPAARQSAGQQRPQQRPDAGGSQSSSSAPGGERRAAGGAGRYVDREDDEDEDENARWAPKKKKTAQEEEDDKDERRRKRQQENDRLYEGLGSHWVKPPPGCSSSAPRRPPEGPRTQTRAKPMPKTKSSRPGLSEERRSKQKRRPSGGSNASECSDGSSDASSVLSFDIHIDLKNFIFTFDLIEPEVDTLNQTEVWTIKPTAASIVKDAESEKAQTADDVAAKPSRKVKAASPKCCALQ